MNLEQFLLGALVYLVAMVVSAPLARRFGLGSVLGFLIAGVVIGPYVLRLIGTEGAEVKSFAEFGVIVMLFLVGLELEPSRLWSLRMNIFGLGLLQVAATAAGIGFASFLFLQDWRAAVAVGLILAMSSTAIILPSLEERGLLKAPIGQSIFSVLLFQDISVIPILAILPLIAISPGHVSEGHSLIGNLPVWLQTLCVISAVAAVVLGGRYLTRPAFRLVAGTGLREIFVAFALLLVVAITLLMSLVGLSAALGTFLAGVVLADSEYRHELENDLQPFKGLLLAIFFIAVGAGIDFNAVVSRPTQLLILLVGFVVLKLAVQFVLARLFKMGTSDATHFSFALAGGSEFGFVLAGIAATLNLISPEFAGLVIAALAISMAATPLLIKFEERLLQPWLGEAEVEREADLIETQGVDVIIAGHGRFGMPIGRVLTARGYRTAVLEHDVSQVDVLRKFGFKVFYGDATRIDLLRAAGAAEAKALVIAMDDREKATSLAQVAQSNFPNLKIFARAFDRVHAGELIKAGIENSYREMFGSSMDLTRDLLVALGVKTEQAKRQVQTFKEHDEKYLRRSISVRGDDKALVDLARQSRVEIAKVFAGDASDAQKEKGAEAAPSPRES